MTTVHVHSFVHRGDCTFHTLYACAQHAYNVWKVHKRYIIVWKIHVHTYSMGKVHRMGTHTEDVFDMHAKYCPHCQKKPNMKSQWYWVVITWQKTSCSREPLSKLLKGTEFLPPHNQQSDKWMLFKTVTKDTYSQHDYWCQITTIIIIFEN